MIAATRRKFTIDEYHQLIDLGFFTENDKIELIRGDIIDMAPKRTAHSVCNSLLWKQLYELIGKQVEIRVQEPIILLANSEPEPDVVIANKKEDNYLSAHPTVADIILLIEISDSTLQYDRETKLPLYAEAGINNYWIVNLVDNHLEVYTNSFSDNQNKFGYRNKSIVLPNENIEIPNFNQVYLRLAAIFPTK
ncbi:MAG: Uma2 family endonuclease [Xenococcaceae cyanobacterium MO_188.B19]|nr:Uma2 family endonuclease [Xenococcaceae cyanobacterium MO_188.B19]